MIIPILADTGVAMLPATAFGMPDNLLATRLCYVDFDNPNSQYLLDLKRDAVGCLMGLRL